MKIGIDISQIVYEGTGVGRYVRRMVEELLKHDKKNEYVLFGASLRKRRVFWQYFKTYLSKRVKLVVVPIPPTILDILWNRLHVIPAEWFIGPVDVFWSSDWTQPPLVRAKGVTTIHDLSFLRYPETFLKTIISIQKRRLAWVKRECKVVLCDSQATAQDAKALLGIARDRLRVIYPGYSNLHL